MSNSIWHKYDIKDMPSLTREILARNGSHHNVCIINREDWKQGFCDWIDRWAYVADIITQADKAERLEKENEAMREEFEVWHENYKCEVEEKKRLQKAVDNYEKVIVGAMFAPDVGDVTAGILEESHKTIKQLIKETSNDK